MEPPKASLPPAIHKGLNVSWLPAQNFFIFFLVYYLILIFFHSHSCWIDATFVTPGS